jgi:hypothetical protein
VSTNRKRKIAFAVFKNFGQFKRWWEASKNLLIQGNKKTTVKKIIYTIAGGPSFILDLSINTTSSV